MQTDRARRGRGAALLLVLWCTATVARAPSSGADEVTPVFTTLVSCSAATRPVPLLPRDLLPVNLPITLPALPVDLFGDGEFAGPGCPASVDTDHQHGHAEAAATSDGAWSMATAARADDGGSAMGNALMTLRTDVTSAEGGDLSVQFDDVTGAFDEACCQSLVDSGYFVDITVSSGAGDFHVGCGTGSFSGNETAYTLPDDRCGLAEDGTPARLPVSAGNVHVEIAISMQSAVSGADFDATRASARISRLSTGRSSAASGSENVAPTAQPAGTGGAGGRGGAGGAVVRAAELARSGSDVTRMAPFGIALIAAGLAADAMARRRAVVAARKVEISALLRHW